MKEVNRAMFAAKDMLKVSGALGAVLLACAMPAFADEASDWNAIRAKLFSQVCLNAAPEFANFGRLAQKAGFKDWNGELLYEPEVVVSLQQDQGACRCYMTVGAPDQTAMVLAMFERMMNEFPNSWQPKSMQGKINDMIFVRDGVKVRVVLAPATIEGNPWISANVIAPGKCPT